MRIPKILHFVWIGPNSPSDLHMDCLQSWKRIHRSYEIKFWTNQDLTIEKFPFTFAYFYKSKSFAECKDILVLEILLNYGGYYIDMDVYCLQHLNNFVDPSTTFLVCNETNQVWQRNYNEEPAHQKGKSIPCTNAFIGTIPGDVLFMDAILELKSKNWGAWTPTNELTGPWSFGRLVEKKIQQPGFQVFTPRTLYEILWNHEPSTILKWAKQIEERDATIDKAIVPLSISFTKKQILGMHLWAQTWRFSFLNIARSTLDYYRDETDDIKNDEKQSQSVDSHVAILIPFRHDPTNWMRIRNLNLVIHHLCHLIRNTTIQILKIHVVLSVQEGNQSTASLISSFCGDAISLLSVLPNVEFSIFTQKCDTEFNRSLAFNQGLYSIQSIPQYWKTSMIFMDADVILSQSSFDETIMHLEKHPYVSCSPYTTIYDLNESQTVHVDLIDQGKSDLYQTIQELYPSLAGQERLGTNAAGGVFCMTQPMFAMSGGWDESFVGWGKEDEALLNRIDRASKETELQIKNMMEEKKANQTHIHECHEMNEMVKEIETQGTLFPIKSFSWDAYHLCHTKI